MASWCSFSQYVYKGPAQDPVNASLSFYPLLHNYLVIAFIAHLFNSLATDYIQASYRPQVPVKVREQTDTSTFNCSILCVHTVWVTQL